jgi:hypothetical protein
MFFLIIPGLLAWASPISALNRRVSYYGAASTDLIGTQPIKWRELR